MFAKVRMRTNAKRRSFFDDSFYEEERTDVTAGFSLSLSLDLTLSLSLSEPHSAHSPVQPYLKALKDHDDDEEEEEKG